MIATTTRPSKVLTQKDLASLAPSIFATSSDGTRSSRYRFVPTTEVVDILRDRGFMPVSAGQTRSRDHDNRMFTRHVLRFRNEDYLGPMQVGEEIPELVLMNSHDGSSAYQLMAGIFRVACSNGLVVQSCDFGSIAVRHSGGRDDKEFSERVIDATYQVLDVTPRIIENIETWKQIELSKPQQEAFARAALELRENPIVTADKLLVPRRKADEAPSLWNTSQVVQENMVKGGLVGTNAKGRRTRTRPIKSVGEDIKTNRALWRLTEEMAKLIG